MSKLQHDIAMHSATLTLRRQHLRKQSWELRSGILQFCKQPTTLVGAAVTGAVLAHLMPHKYAKTRVDNKETSNRALPGAVSTTLRFLLISAFSTWLKSAFQPTSFTPEMPGKSQLKTSD